MQRWRTCAVSSKVGTLIIQFYGESLVLRVINAMLYLFTILCLRHILNLFIRLIIIVLLKLTPQGRNNVFLAIVLFLHYVRDTLGGRLDGVNLADPHLQLLRVLANEYLPYN